MKRSFDALRAHTQQHAHAHKTSHSSHNIGAASAASAAAGSSVPPPAANARRSGTSLLLAKLGRLGTEAAGAHEWSGRLRNRHRSRHHHHHTHTDNTAAGCDPAAGAGGVADDIESGVEITEEMVVQLQQPATAEAAKRVQMALGRQASLGDEIFEDVRDDDDGDFGAVDARYVPYSVCCTFKIRTPVIGEDKCDVVPFDHHRLATMTVVDNCSRLGWRPQKPQVRLKCQENRQFKSE